MRIALVHNRYLQAGGEDVVAENECAWLKSRGHEVLLLMRTNAKIGGLGPLKSLLNVLQAIWWPPSMRGALAEIEKFGPDVVHIHNLWYQFNPSLIRGLKAKGIPVVMTLHNFRLVCANGLLFRQGRTCHKCVGSTGLWGVFHRCYRKSGLLSLCVVLMSKVPWALGVWRRDVSAFLCLTPFSRDLFIRAGFPPEKLHVKPNFIPRRMRAGGARKTSEPTAAFVGRLSEEKGFPLLLSAWKRRGETLCVAGSGEFDDTRANIRYLGQLGREETLDLIERSWILVVPSVWHETFGLVIAEAFMLGTPVLASANGTFETLIEHGKTGMLFEKGNPDALLAGLDALFGNAELRRNLAEAGRREYEKRFAADGNGEALEGIYRRMVPA